jgi:hypothetical protein
MKFRENRSIGSKVQWEHTDSMMTTKAYCQIAQCITSVFVLSSDIINPLVICHFFNYIHHNGWLLGNDMEGSSRGLFSPKILEFPWELKQTT